MKLNLIFSFSFFMLFFSIFLSLLSKTIYIISRHDRPPKRSPSSTPSFSKPAPPPPPPPSRTYATPPPPPSRDPLPSSAPVRPSPYATQPPPSPFMNSRILETRVVSPSPHQSHLAEIDGRRVLLTPPPPPPPPTIIGHVTDIDGCRFLLTPPPPPLSLGGHLSGSNNQRLVRMLPLPPSVPWGRNILSPSPPPRPVRTCFHPSLPPIPEEEEEQERPAQNRRGLKRKLARAFRRMANCWLCSCF